MKAPHFFKSSITTHSLTQFQLPEDLTPQLCIALYPVHTSAILNNSEEVHKNLSYSKQP